MRKKVLLATMAAVLLFSALLLSSIFSPQTFAATNSTDIRHDGRVCPATINKGSSGTAVSALQWELDWVFGYNLTVNGKFGPDTEAAVKDFQNQYAPPADGIVNATTWHALGRC